MNSWRGETDDGDVRLAAAPGTHRRSDTVPAKSGDQATLMQRSLRALWTGSPPQVEAALQDLLEEGSRSPPATAVRA